MPENHHIEDFFRKRLENHELNFQEEDWLLLEKRLEMVHPSPSAIELHFTPRTILIIAAALTATFFLGWMASELFQNKNTKKTLPGRTEQNQTPAVNPEQYQVPSLKIEKNQGSVVNTEQEQISAVSIVQNQTSAVSIEQNQISIVNSAPITESNSIAKSGEYITIAAIHIADAEHIPATTEIIPLTGKIIPLQGLAPPQLSLPNISGFDIARPPADNMPVGYSWITKWSIGLILAPDYNGVRLFRGNTVTAAVGGIISFHFASRWSASVRAIYNNKKYSSQPHYYQLPEGYWINRTNGVIPDNIAVSCRIIDVPVMVTFKFLQKKKVSFIASAGLGSYFMLDEKYNFEFNQSNPGADTQWQTRNNSTVLFGTANIALGVGFQTTSRINVAFEPYLKLPLKGIGWGNVDLYSMGLSLIIKYKL